VALWSDGVRPGRTGRFVPVAVPPVAPPRPVRERGPAGIRRPLGLCPEIDCLRHRLPPAALAAAEARARTLDVGADEVLVASGLLTEDAYGRALALSLQLHFVALDELPRSACPLADDALLRAARTNVLALKGDGDPLWVVASRGLQARAFIALMRTRPDLRRRFCVTTPERLRRFVEVHCGDLIAYRAAEALRAGYPALSAARRPLRARGWLALAALACGIAAAPGASLALAEAALTAIFLAATVLRLVAAAHRAPAPERPAPPLRDAALPRYTVVAALYDEVEALPGLIAALAAFDYPAEKLEILLVLEADDAWTRLAAEFLQKRARFHVLLAAPQGPRTKPKALNCALPFARGDLLVVFDAEDRPEPDQLRRAANAFAAGGDALACVQARLTIDNARDGWLTRLFAAEYAGLFDVLLPGLAALRLPIPLGGSSNHFRTAALRAVGGWDPHNVTEDADLGIRLARFGYASGVIASSTYEEAPAQVRPWLYQRTRWLNGWMQTLIVHMREPRRLWREAGTAGAAAFYLILGGTCAAALVQPIVLLWLALAWVAGIPLLPHGGPTAQALAGWTHVAAFATGYAAAALVGLVGLKRRGLLSLAWCFAALPLLWLMISAAAWRALVQLVRAPQLWEKTRHGLARTSQRGRRDQ
jgi:cellulose synthase/poly-beta-1,6-N-acetylglucosamine synthase-like glycosyltransferase